jgi:hypothetical protein
MKKRLNKDIRISRKEMASFYYPSIGLFKVITIKLFDKLKVRIIDW